MHLLTYALLILSTIDHEDIIEPAYICLLGKEATRPYLLMISLLPEATQLLSISTTLYHQYLGPDKV